MKCIRCGVEGESTEELFWPLFKVTALPIGWQFTDSCSTAILFTSRNAVRCFYDHCKAHAHSLPFLNHEAVLIGSVGDSTHAVAQARLTLLFRNPPTFVYPRSAVGLAALFDECGERIKECAKQEIFTSLDGRTPSILSRSEYQAFSRCAVTECYRLDPVGILPESVKDALGELSSKLILFECGSGKVARAVVSCLQDFFGCANPGDLSRAIFFEARGESTLEAIRELGLEDRILG